MTSIHRNLADFLRTVALNHKFMEDRRKEVQAYCCLSQVGLLGSFPLTNRPHYSHNDLRKFLNSRCITWTDDDFEAILEQISPVSALDIQTYELGIFLGLSHGSKPPHTNPPIYDRDEMLDIQIVRLFEQTISCHRKT
jgi:hypothetical protein